MRGEHGIEDLRDSALLGLGQGFDLFELLLDLRCWPALAVLGAFGRDADQLFDRHIERIGELGEGAGEQTQAAGLVGVLPR